MSIKLLSILTITLLLCANTAFGQETNSSRINSLFAGSKALQFEIDSDFQISTFRSSSITYKAQTSSRSATRFGLSVSKASSDSLTNQVISDGRFDTTAIDFSSWSIQITAHRVYNSRQDRRLSFYWGLGPTAGFSRRIRDRVRTRSSAGGIPPIQEDYRFSETKNWNAGAYFVGGMEFFVFRNISLIIVRAVSFEYTRSESTVSRESFYAGESFFSNETKQVNTSLNFRQNLLRFGLSVYF